MKPSTHAVFLLLAERGPAGVTPLEALAEVGTFRLAARIAELRRAGANIESRTETSGGKRYARYRLVTP